MTYVHILRPGAHFYTALARRAGHRKWQLVAKTKSSRKAHRLASDAIASHGFKRAVVLQWPVFGDPSPFEIARMVRT
jgi:hypothetical protein